MSVAPTPRSAVPYQHPLITDIYLGAVRGDFAPEMGGAGRLTQAVLGFVPIIGNVCAARDMFADFHQGDRVGGVLNGIAMIPGIGGISKIAAVLRAMRRTGRILRAGRMLGSNVPAAGPPPERARQ